MSEQNTPKTNSRILLLAIITGALSVFLAILFFLAYHCFILDISPETFLREMVTTLYIPHYNSFIIPPLFGNHIYAIIYLIFLLALIFLKLTLKMIAVPQTEKSLKSALTVISLSLVLFIATLEHLGHLGRFQVEKHQFTGKSMEAKNASLFTFLYRFANEATKQMPYQCQGDIVSDLDFSNDPYLTWNIVLSYHLYPTISLRFKNFAPKDCMVLLFKKDITGALDDHYRILYSPNDDNLILAIKKRP